MLQVGFCKLILCVVSLNGAFYSSKCYLSWFDKLYALKVDNKLYWIKKISSKYYYVDWDLSSKINFLKGKRKNWTDQ